MDSPANQAQAASPATASPLACFDATRAAVDRVLSGIPDNRLEARRVITREWAFDPTPEELQMIVRVAHDPAVQGGLPRELARAALAARVFVEQSVCGLLEAGRLDGESFGETARVLPAVQNGVEALEKQLHSIGEIVSAEERALLSRVSQILLPPSDVLVTAGVLIPPLEHLARSTGPQEIRSHLGALADEEVALLADALWPEWSTADDAAPGTGACWTCAEGIVLAAVIREDLAAHVAAPDGAGKVRPEALARDKIAYHVVAGRLQKRRDEAMLAGLRGYADKLQHVQQVLFATYRGLAAALNLDVDDSSDGSEPLHVDADLRRLLDESAAQDALAEAERSNRVSEEELYLDALEDIGSPEAPAQRPLFSPTYDPRRQRLRIRVLSTIAVVLLAVCAGVWTSRLSQGADPLAVDLDALSDSLILDEAISVGPMLYAVVSHWSWDSMSDEERLSSVRALGLGAANEGYESVYLVDERRQQLALWTKKGGAELKKTAAPEDPA